MRKRTRLVASAAMLFVAGSMTQIASAESAVKCSGVNSCKGTSACKTESSSCRGQNSCKGQGWSEVATTGECTSKGGKIL
jgi:hypothetical protein